MKRIFILLCVVACAAGIYSCRKKGVPPESFKLDSALLKDTTKIEFLDSTTFHFDTINQGDKVEHTFRMKNVGDKNLIIARAFGSCGCTVPQYPKDPVKPGDTAIIHVTFNSTGKENMQNKTVTVICNTDQRNEMLYLNGFVRVKK